MSGRARWALVAALAALLVTSPFVVQAWPTPASGLTAVEVAERVAAAGDHGYSGTVASRGGIELPGEETIGGVAKILGRDGVLRVWWQDPSTWRVATVRPSGETDIFHSGTQSTRWVYESRNVTTYPDARVRLPNSTDVLPPLLAARVLDGARPEELSRLPTRRVAGRVAVGVRLVPGDRQSSIGHVDVWSDLETGLGLRVELYGEQGPSVLATTFTGVDTGRPDPEAMRFTAPPGSHPRYDDTIDLAALAEKYDFREVPATLAGLPQRVSGTAVGLYGRGPTVLLAVAIRPGEAQDLRRELRSRPGTTCLRDGDLVQSGPVTMMLTRRPWPFAADWLVAGTVTQDALVQAGRELPRRPISALPGRPTKGCAS